MAQLPGSPQQSPYPWMSPPWVNPPLTLPAARRGGSITSPTAASGTPPKPQGLLSFFENPENSQALMSAGAAMLEAGGYSPVPVSLGQAMGRGTQAWLLAKQSASERALNEALLRKQMEPKPIEDPQSVREYQFAKENGYGGTFEEWKRVGGAGSQARQGMGLGNLNPGDYTPESWAAFIPTYDPATGMGNVSLLKRYVTPANPLVVQMGGGQSVVTPSRTGAAPVVQELTSGVQEREAAADLAAARAAAEADARVRAQTQAERDTTFAGDLARIDDEIERTERLIGEFEAGKYQTGPIAGRLPNFRTAAQDLNREQGKDTLAAISSATFGALSEGERGFLRELGISDTATEESNLNLLRRRRTELIRTRDRLKNRPSLVNDRQPDDGWSVREK